MHLSREEEKMLGGAQGEAVRLAMEILSKVGDVYGAREMVEIDSAHTNLTTYRNIMDAGVEVCEKFADLGGKYRVLTTLDIAGMDLLHWREFGISKDYAGKQMRIVRAHQKMGAVEMWTCTPYFHFNPPTFGKHVGWAESSAVVFANSVIGARTNRLATVVDMAAGIAGRVPRFGLHLNENRRGRVLVEIKCDRKCLTNADYPTIGCLLGEKVNDRIPVLKGIPPNVSVDQLKNMGAAAAASGSVALYHIPGITPEARTIEEAFRGEKPEETIVLDSEELKTARQRMCTIEEGNVDFVAVGCPHYSIRELAKLATLLKGKKVCNGVNFWIYTSRYTERVARRMGYVDAIEASGARISTDTCMLDSPTDTRGFKTLITDSGKCAYYAPVMCKTEVIYGSIEDCVKAATKGYFQCRLKR